jgi:hypothetical protein
LDDFDAFWEKCLPAIQEEIATLSKNNGDYYQSNIQLQKAIGMSKERTILIFGKDSDYDNLRELTEVRDYLSSKEYDAYLLKQLPEHPQMSNEEKAKLWAMVSRFCVMIDREPSGHIAEYTYLKNSRTVLAFLRLKGKGSTYMIGDDSLLEINHIKVFEFEKSPLEVLSDAVEWAEDFLAKKEQTLNKAYPWRKE